MHPRISIRGCVRPSVGPSVRRSARPLVGMYVCHAFVKNAWNREFYVQKWSWRHTKSWITSKQLSSTSTTRGGYCRTQISSSHLSHLYKRICPKMLEDASLAAGPCLIIKTSWLKLNIKRGRIHAMSFLVVITGYGPTKSSSGET